MQPHAVKDTYIPEEVAKATGKSIHTVYRHLRSGKLPAEKFGGEWIITPKALREWLPEPLFRRHFGTENNDQ